MAVKTIAVKMTLDAGQTVSEVDKLNNSLEGTEEHIDDIADSGKRLSEIDKRFADLNKRVGSGEMSMRDMSKAVKEYMTIALQAGEESPIGKAALQEAGQLKDRIGDLSAAVDGLSKDGRALQTSLQLGQGVLAGYSAFQGIASLVGDENEDLAKTMMKLQAAQSALMGVEQLHASLQKETLLRKRADAIATGIQTAATTAYNAVVGTSTGVLKLFRIALISTGIGAIIVGIGLLVANFDKIVAATKGAIAEFGNLHDILLILMGPIGWVILAYQKIFSEEAKLEDARERQARILREQTQALTDQREADLKALDDLRKAEAKAHLERQKGYDLEIDRMEAEGKSSRELKLAKIQDLLDEQQAILDTNAAKIQVWVNYYKQLALLRGQSEQEFIDAMMAQGIDLLDLQQKANALLAENEQAVYEAETNLIALKNEFRKEDAANADAARKEEDAKNKAAYDAEVKRLQEMNALRQKQADELFNRRVKARDQLAELENAASNDEMAQLAYAHELRIETLDETIPEENELKLYYEDLYLQEQAALREKWRAEDAAKEEEAAEKKKAVNAEIANQAMELAVAINDFANQLADNKISKIEKDAKRELSVKGLSEKQKFDIEMKAAKAIDEINKKRFQREKAFKIANAIIDGASATLKALGSAPPPANFILAGIVGAAAAVQIATISAQKFEGSAGNITPPDFSSAASSAGNAGSGGGTQQSGPTGDANQGTETNINDILNGPKTQKVIVVETDITDAVDKVANIKEMATL